MLRSSRPRGARFLVLGAVGAVALAGTGLAALPAASATPRTAPSATAAVTAGAFVPLPASRVIDTRLGLGVPKGKVGPNSTVISRMTGRTNLPPNGSATAVVLNLTSANSTALSYLTAWSAGQAQRPATSSLNFPGGVTRANLVTVPLMSDGRIAIYNAFGYTDVVADVIGYYSSQETLNYGGYQPFGPFRDFDSRTEGVRFADGEGEYLGHDFSGNGYDHNDDITGWVLNVTAVKPTSDGYLTAWDGVDAQPGTSSVNFKAGMTTANLVQVKSGQHTFSDGRTLPSFAIAATLFGGDTDMVVDVVGLFTRPGASQDARFVALPTPQRIVDTRKADAPNLRPGQTRTFGESLGTTDTIALATNLTLVQPTTPAYVTVWDSGANPGISNVNSAARDIVANGAITGVATGTGVGGTFKAYNNAGTTAFVVDVTGTFDTPTAPVAPSARAAATSGWTGGQAVSERR